MNKAYSRINFQNAPSTATPLNATNLNKIDKAINDLDDRIIELSGYQEEAQEAAEQASSSASAAAKAAETATADAEARVNEVIQGLEVYTKADSHKKFASVIKQVATGSPRLITDSSDATAIDFKGKGRSTQKQYSGKNFLENTATTTSLNGGTFTVNEDGSVNVKGAFTDVTEFLIGTYNATESSILSGCPSGGSENTYQLRSSGIGADYGGGLGITAGSNTSIYIRVMSGQTIDITFKPMVRLASITDATYEPYVGGTASPNPDYPQDIKSVGECGYFDGELLQGHYDASTGIYNSSNAKYVCSKNPMPCTTGDTVNLVYEESARVLVFIFYDKDMKFISANQKATSNTLSATVPDNAKYMHINASIIDGNIAPSATKKIVVTINDTYALKVKSVRKNLWSFGNLNGVGVILTQTPCDYAKGTYTLSFVSDIDSGATDFIFRDKNNVLVGQASIANKLFVNRGSVTVTLSDNAKYILVYSNTSVNYTDIQLEFGDKATDYEPYKETVSYIPLNEPLRSINSVTDEVSTTEVTRRFAEVVFDGSSDELWSTYAPQESRPDGTYCYFVSVADNKKMEYNSSTCTHFNNKVSAWTIGDVGTFSDHNKNNYLYFVTDKSTFSEWKAWLQANPITVQYELAEPITETIEPVDIVTYDNVTYISNADNAEMEVTYATDTKSYIDSKFAELHAALVNML